MIPHWLYDIGFFALLFFVLVFIHELGHFLMAKWVGICVERFSIGMGPSLFAFKWGETEYKLGLLPLGGYVKMAGDDPAKEYSDDEKKRGFLSKTPPQKLLVVFGGPVFNLILPVILFSAMLLTGLPNVEPIVGTLEKERAAVSAGLVSGDRVLEIDGKKIKKFQEIEKIVDQSAGRTLHFKIERLKNTSGEKEILEIEVAPQLIKTKSKFGEDIEAYRIGLSPEFEVAQVFFDSPESVAAKAGLKRFDRITKIDQASVPTRAEFLRVIEGLTPGEHHFELDREGHQQSLQVVIPDSPRPVAERLGLISTELVVGRVEESSPAAKAGLQVGDRLLAIGGSTLPEFSALAEKVRSSEGKPLEVVWSRDGKEMKALLEAKSTTIDDPVLGKDNPLAREPVYRIGVASAKGLDTPLVFERSLNPFVLVGRGLSETWSMMSTTVQALYKLFTGQLSMKLLGSPIMIYKVAGNSYRIAGGGYMGWISFLSNLALLSITLGLVNLLPVPVLDGGHATFFLIEWIRRKPVSLRVMEIAMQVGFFLLIALFGFVLVNDVNRYQLLEPLLKLFR